MFQIIYLKCFFKVVIFFLDAYNIYIYIFKKSGLFPKLFIGKNNYIEKKGKRKKKKQWHD